MRGKPFYLSKNALPLKTGLLPDSLRNKRSRRPYRGKHSAREHDFRISGRGNAYALAARFTGGAPLYPFGNAAPQKSGKANAYSVRKRNFHFDGKPFALPEYICRQANRNPARAQLRRDCFSGAVFIAL